MNTPNALLHRRDVVNELVRDRRDLLVIAGLGAPNWDVSSAGDHANNFPLWGAMGGASMIGLGLALAQPKRKVLVITGDGELLMNVGSLAPIAVEAPKNLTIAVLDNDYVYGTAHDIKDLPEVLVERLRHYFETYKLVPDRPASVTIERVYGRAHALKVVDAAVKDYCKHFGEQ